MKRNNAMAKLYIILFIVIMCLPYPLWIFFGKYFDTANYENRSRKAKPLFNVDTYETFASDYTTYMNDNLPFKNALISFNSRVDYYLFHSSSSDRVIIGKDGWLFYNDTADGDPLGDYRGEKIYSEEELQAIVENLQDMEKYLAERGIEFVIFVAPNKERIYAEMMPDYYGEPAEEYAALQIVNYIKDHTNIRIVYPYMELMQAKSLLPEIDLYYKTDTHWNEAGGYVGSKVLLNELGITVPNITDDEFVVEGLSYSGGDLTNILHLRKDFEDNSYNISGYDNHNVSNEKWDFPTELIYHCENADQRKLFVVRDSFFTSMSEFMASQFNDSYMIHRNVYDHKYLMEQSPDIFVYEVVERYIETLGTFSLLYTDESLMETIEE